MDGKCNTAEAAGPAATLEEQIHADIWSWLKAFVSAKNSFYNGKFAPCPYARTAMLQAQVDVTVYSSGNVFDYIRARSLELRDTERLSTRVMAFAPRHQGRWGMTEFVETLNAELIADNIFLNTGVTKTMPSRHPGAAEGALYFIVVANRLDAVLAGADALKRTVFYRDWPAEQYNLVVVRRELMAGKYGARTEPGDVAISS